MELSLQLQLLTVSFVYGILISYLITIQKYYLFETKSFYKILVTTLFVFDVMLLYFLIIRTIDNGIFHIYFLFSIIIGFIFGNYLVNKNKWLTSFFVKGQKMSFYLLKKIKSCVNNDSRESDDNGKKEEKFKS